MSSPRKVPPLVVAHVIERARHYLYRLHQQLVPPSAAMAELILAGWVSQAIHAAAHLGVAEALTDGPLPLDELARQIGSDSDALRRLMRALIGRGIFGQLSDGRYALTPLAQTLRSDAPASMAGAALFYGSATHREHWSLLADSVRTGKASVPVLRGKEFFDYLDDEPQFGELFNAAMTSLSASAMAPLVAGYDFTEFPTIVDVGGGHGALLSAILDSAPRARGVLYDLPHVVTESPALLAQLGVGERVRTESGSFFDSVPSGGDAYVLKNVVHDWPDEQALIILRHVRSAAGKTAKLLLLEFVIHDRGRDFLGNWVDLEMLLVLQSRERTAQEYCDLLRQAGFRMVRVVHTASPFSVIEAVPD